MTNIKMKLGDERLNHRGQESLSKLQMDPSLSFPKMFHHAHDLQGFYRFMNNDSFSHIPMFAAVA